MHPCDFLPLRLVLGGLAIGVLTLSGCSSHRDAAAPSFVPKVGTPLAGDFGSSGEGSLHSANALPDVDPRLAEVSSLAAHITYGSRSGVDDSQREVSAAVFVPKGDPPPGGWPMVAFGHPATGLRPECGPSNSSTLFGSAEMVAQLVAGGHLVVVPDYQGLGLNGSNHPFLDSATVGYNLIDSMSAVRKLKVDTSDQWIAVGVGQGGQAAWSANELAVDHSLGLDLRGAVSLSPLADVEGIADLAAAGRLTSDQVVVLVRYIQGLRDTYGDAIHLDDFRHGVTAAHWDQLLSCSGGVGDPDAVLTASLGADDLKPRDAEAYATLQGFLQKTTLPQGPARAPMLVIYGAHDPVVPPEWTRRAIEHACAMGDSIQIVFQTDTGGAAVNASSMAPWMTDRFNGVPPVNDCAAQ